MSGNQHYNQKFDKKSWVVTLKNLKPRLEQSYFAIGYTADHRATEEEAILVAIGKNINEITRLKENLDALNAMLAEYQSPKSGMDEVELSEARTEANLNR